VGIMPKFPHTNVRVLSGLCRDPEWVRMLIDGFVAADFGDDPEFTSQVAEQYARDAINEHAREMLADVDTARKLFDQMVQGSGRYTERH